MDDAGKEHIKKVIDDFNQHEKWVIKDPRLVGMLKYWYVDGAGVIVVARNPFFSYIYRKTRISQIFAWKPFLEYWYKTYVYLKKQLDDLNCPYMLSIPAEEGEDSLKKISKFIGYDLPSFPVERDILLPDKPNCVEGKQYLDRCIDLFGRSN